MTTEEFKEKISKAADKEWFQNIEAEFNFPYVGYKKKITGITAIYEFVNQQTLGWKDFVNLPDKLSYSKEYFKNIKKEIIALADYITQDASSLNNIWVHDIQSAIKNTSRFPSPHELPEIKFLLDIQLKAPEYFDSAYHCIFKTNQFNLNDMNSIYGAMLAYEFMLNKHLDLDDIITKMQRLKHGSLSKLKNDFDEYLSTAIKQLVEHLNNANLKYNEYIDEINRLKDKKEKLFDEWFEPASKKVDELESKCQERMQELENTYKEKLKLEEPAKYWSERADKLKRNGIAAFFIMILLTFVACFSLSVILWNTPETIYASWFGDDKSAAVRWTIVYITFISFIAYCVRAILKVMFSSYHLMRDCEERHTLTYFYLSLLKDAKVDEKDRQLIMQSLFSRAETGLLKDDASPTMPNDIMRSMTPKQQ
jgi:ElaB/YqjD/DUF883 family membrane-anchored ribosome-binding protein